MELGRLAVKLAVLMIMLGASKVGYEAYAEYTSTTTTTSTTSSTTSTTTSSTSTTTTTTTTTSTTTYHIIYTTTLWGNCYDGLRNQNELGIDCGGTCKPCRIACTENSDCGLPHYDSTICLDGDVYKPFIEYECIDPWMANSTCRMKKKFIFKNKCSVNEQCVETNFCTGEQCIYAQCIDNGLVCTWIDC